MSYGERPEITDEQYQSFEYLWAHFGNNKDGDAPPATRMAALSDADLIKECRESYTTLRAAELWDKALYTEYTRRNNIRSIQNRGDLL
jgi:hypothetical protein